MPKHSNYLRIRLQMERDKLTYWAVLTNLSEDEKTLNSSLLLNQHKVNGAFQEIRMVLLDLTKRYQSDRPSGSSLVRPSSSSNYSKPPSRLTYSLQEKAVNFAERTRTFPRQLTWGTIEKREFELMLAKLTALNQNMMYFFDEREQRVHMQMQENTFMGILQQNNKLDDLLDVTASLDATKVYRPPLAHEKSLLQLARFKAFRVAVEETGGVFNEGKIRDQIGYPPASSNRIQLDTSRYIVEKDSDSELQPARTWGTYENKPVWVDWRYCKWLSGSLV